MSALFTSSTLLNVFVSIGACFSVAAVVFLVMAVRSRRWGDAAVVSAMLTIAVFGWIFSLQQGYLPVGNPDLEVGDQIEITGAGSLYLTWVPVLNRGTGSARNCVVEIEYRTPEDEDYEYLGYALFDRESVAPHTESRFWLVRARSYDEGLHWETSIMLRDVRDYADQESGAVDYPLGIGEHYLRLTVIAENAVSRGREYKLYVPEDKTQLPELGALP